MSIEISTLNIKFAEQHASTLLSFTNDQSWESWTKEKLLRDALKSGIKACAQH